jgi:hypothetical protein
MSLSAVLTKVARMLSARAYTEGVVLGDWTFQCGSGGFNNLNPFDITEVDPTLQTLLSPIGDQKPLGRVRSSGSGASALNLGNGLVQVEGLVGIPATPNRHLTISGAISPNLDGTWAIRERIDDTSVVIYAPLVTNAGGSLDWEFRDLCIARPNDKATDFHCRLEAADAVGLEIGEVAVFARLIVAPSSPIFPLPVAKGDRFLFAKAHMPPVAKSSEMALNFHVCVQS